MERPARLPRHPLQTGRVEPRAVPCIQRAHVASTRTWSRDRRETAGLLNVGYYCWLGYGHPGLSLQYLRVLNWQPQAVAPALEWVRRFGSSSLSANGSGRSIRNPLRFIASLSDGVWAGLGTLRFLNAHKKVTGQISCRQRGGDIDELVPRQPKGVQTGGRERGPLLLRRAVDPPDTRTDNTPELMGVIVNTALCARCSRGGRLHHLFPRSCAASLWPL